MRLGVSVTGADSEMEITVQEVYQGMLLELIPVEKKERKQDWAEGEIEPGALKLGRFFRVILSLKPHVDQSLKADCPEKGAGLWSGQFTSAQGIPARGR